MVFIIDKTAGGMLRSVRLADFQLTFIPEQHSCSQAFPRPDRGLSPHLLSSELPTRLSLVGTGTVVSTGKGVELLASASGWGYFVMRGCLAPCEAILL